ncbi:MAG: hypothetical protein COB46_13400 [Rhodospirillaceae bacterium]|nr:MAG: hypothetical protein COB46_13400 [Rhodospirillaceae bacterium]
MKDQNNLHNNNILVVASGKGGIGKSLLSLAIADLFELNDKSLQLYQLDDQQRLEKAVGQNVISPDIKTLKLARRDPTAITKVFDPLYAGIEALPKSNNTLLLDVGATQIGNLIDYAGLIDLEEDLQLFGLSGFVFIPVVAEPESLRQACRAIQEFQTTLPSLAPVFVENLRDGPLSELSSASQAGQIFSEELSPLIRNFDKITMPLIEAGSWRAFEQNHCRLIDVGTMSIPEVMNMTGLSRPESKLSRGDVLAFFAQMEDELSNILAFEERD